MPSDRALYVIRQSQGEDENTASLREQRQLVPRLARELAGSWDRVDALDLGVHTGFSIHSREKEESRIDANDDVLDAVERVEAGDYSYVVALNDTRIARDDYFSRWKRAARLGDAEFVFYSDDVETGTLSHDIQRKVEEHAKKKEIERAKNAVRARANSGKWNSRAPRGLEFDSDGDYLVPGEDYYACLEVIAARDSGESWRDIEDRTGIPYSTARRIYDNRERYEVFVERSAGVVEEPERFARVA